MNLHKNSRLRLQQRNKISFSVPFENMQIENCNKCNHQSSRLVLQDRREEFGIITLNKMELLCRSLLSY